MNATDIATIKRAIEILGFQNKIFLNRNEIDRLVKELSLNREYRLADYIRSIDPAQVANFLR